MPVAVAEGRDPGDPGDLPDEDLPEQFLCGEELESQDAFRARVVRHGPSLPAIGRHVLDKRHDAEDVVQATFLSLAQKGASISDRRAASGWLREVMYRTALRSRGRACRRRQVEG